MSFFGEIDTESVHLLSDSAAITKGETKACLPGCCEGALQAST